MWGVGWGCMLAQGTPLSRGYPGEGGHPAQFESVPPLRFPKSEQARVMGKPIAHGCASDNY